MGALAKSSQDTASRDIDDLVKRKILVKTPGGAHHELFADRRSNELRPRFELVLRKMQKVARVLVPAGRADELRGLRMIAFRCINPSRALVATT